MEFLGFGEIFLGGERANIYVKKVCLYVGYMYMYQMIMSQGYPLTCKSDALLTVLDSVHVLKINKKLISLRFCWCVLHESIFFEIFFC